MLLCSKQGSEALDMLPWITENKDIEINNILKFGNQVYHKTHFLKDLTTIVMRDWNFKVKRDDISESWLNAMNNKDHLLL